MITKEKRNITTEESKKAEEPVVTEKPGVYVYLGPSVRGVIQSGTIFSGTRSEIKTKLQSAIEKYPHIETLLAADTEIAVAKAKLRKGGNALSHAYKALTAE